jgi:hypothetical protein
VSEVIGKQVQEIKLFVLLIILYIGFGIILFPNWHYNIIEDGGLRELIDVAFSGYLYQSLVAILIILSIVWCYHYFEVKKLKIITLMAKLLNSIYYPLILIAISLIAIVNLAFIGFQRISIKNQDYVDSVGTIKKAYFIESPVDFIYIDAKSINQIAEQIDTGLVISNKSIRENRKNTLGGEAGMENVGKVKADKSSESEETTDYKAIETTVVKKTINTINSLSFKNKLLVIKSIEIQSSELRDFDLARELLSNKYRIVFDSKAINTVRDKIISNNINSILPEEFRDLSWVIVSGQFNATINRESVVFSFDYVPSITSSVILKFEVPYSELSIDDANLLLSDKNWELNAFCRILHKKILGNTVEYTLRCYAIYR